MTSSYNSFYTLHSANCSLVLECRDAKASILYWGASLNEATSPEMLALLNTRQEAQACVEVEAQISLSPEFGAGFLGNAGLQLHRSGQDWATFTEIQSLEHDAASNQLVVTSFCANTQVEVVHRLALDVDSDVLSASTKVTNKGDADLTVVQCNAPTIEVPMHFDKILGFDGRWANEFQLQSVDRFAGAYLRENRSGRTSHNTFPGVVIHTEQTNESAGEAMGLHLAWSGNHRMLVEEKSIGRAYAQMGELLYPGEVQLASGESYTSPTLFGARSSAGFSGLSRCFHRYVRGHLIDERIPSVHRPVHFNTWEAMYFDLDLSRLCNLADAAAEVGVERFVLDDGWFKNRKSDQAGLGDWTVDEGFFPDGLSPLIEHVNNAGMEFGLWVEPEMVNPDSDLYRAHPDWVLSAEPVPLSMFRNQLVLDLTRPEVVEYLFGCIDDLLTTYPIRYLKWDMNRDINQPGGHDGKPAVHKQVLALYGLLERLRAAHPTVEIESCSSGGGRADYGILQHTDRVWTSDTNDAIDRLRVQKGFSFFFPPEAMGAHVGPHDCHITGRKINMATRAGVAMFGHMGIEANLLDMNSDEKEELSAAVALHKKHRELILSSDLIRLDMADYEHGFGVVSSSQDEALFSYALIASHPHSAPGRFRFAGLDASAHYEINLVWPHAPRRYSAQLLDIINGQVLSGDALMQMGMQLPVMFPENLLVLHLKRAE